MEQILVSIIISVYNVEQYIKKSLDSVLNQTYKYLEIILVDDGSTDSSGMICDDYSKKDSKFITIHKENGGLASARNTGLQKSSGKYIYFMDSDDWITPTLIADNLSIIEEYNADVIIFGFVKELKVGKKVNLMEIIPPLLHLNDKKDYEDKIFMLFNSGCGFSIWNQMIKREYLVVNDLEFPIYKRGADMCFLFGLYATYPKLVINQSIYYHFNSFYTAKKFDPNIIKNHIHFYEKILKIHNKWFEKKQNKKVVLKIFLLWFSHVIPNAIVRNRRIRHKQKIHYLYSMYQNSRIRNFINYFHLSDANNFATFMLYIIFKFKSPHLLLFSSVIRIFIKQNVKVDYKKWYFKKN